MRKRLHGWWIGTWLLLLAPSTLLAYFVCTDVVTVHPNGATSQCRICTIYSNSTGEEQGEISNCPEDRDNPRGGPV